MTPPRKSSPLSHEVGKLGEQLVALWLQQQGWQILQQRWRCREGEIDLIAQSEAEGMAFVEVKTRRRGNWDEDGRLAVDERKKRRFSQAAEVFLSRFPQWADLPCRFDCAFVRSRSLNRGESSPLPPTLEGTSSQIEIGQPLRWGSFELTLQEYLIDAFEAF
ncbi:YraN family protein [Spirulina subsalsa]|uniref:YraN family protein n=1 Tax=Spirulina subsalsa TaxID=54311 RepID=UPI00031CEFF3|nr:YraN family protein [Spirulina subsalsa]